MNAGLGVLGVILVIFLVILAILWCLMPFLIMGTNSRLDRIIRQNEEMLERMDRVRPLT